MINGFFENKMRNSQYETIAKVTKLVAKLQYFFKHSNFYAIIFKIFSFTHVPPPHLLNSQSPIPLLVFGSLEIPVVNHGPSQR